MSLCFCLCLWFLGLNVGTDFSVIVPSPGTALRLFVNEQLTLIVTKLRLFTCKVNYLFFLLYLIVTLLLLCHWCFPLPNKIKRGKRSQDTCSSWLDTIFHPYLLFAHFPESWVGEVEKDWSAFGDQAQDCALHSFAILANIKSPISMHPISSFRSVLFSIHISSEINHPANYNKNLEQNFLQQR